MQYDKFTFTLADTGKKKTIRLLGENELSKYNKIGQGIGTCLEICFVEGVWHCERFQQRVVGYRYVKDVMLTWIAKAYARLGAPEKGKGYMSVDFYEKRNDFV